MNRDTEVLGVRDPGMSYLVHAVRGSISDGPSTPALVRTYCGESFTAFANIRLPAGSVTCGGCRHELESRS